MRVRTKRRRQVDISEDDPTNIARHILKGFNLAYPDDAYNGPDTADNLRAAEIVPEDRQAWKMPKHPVNPNLTCIGTYPLLPDWDAMPDTGSYMAYKFMAPPINNPNDPSYDSRLDVALLRPAGQTVEDHNLYVQEQEAHKQDPTIPLPIPRYDFELFLPPDREKVHGIKRNFTTHDPDNDTEIPFDETQDEDGRAKKYFKYELIRTYETQNQVGDPENTYGDVVALAIHDPEQHEEEPLRGTKLQKAAYFYPIIQKTNLRSRRPGKVEMALEEPKVDIIETAARDPDAEVERRRTVRQRYDPIGA